MHEGGIYSIGVVVLVSSGAAQAFLLADGVVFLHDHGGRGDTHDASLLLQARRAVSLRD